MCRFGEAGDEIEPAGGMREAVKADEETVGFSGNDCVRSDRNDWAVIRADELEEHASEEQFAERTGVVDAHANDVLGPTHRCDC